MQRDKKIGSHSLLFHGFSSFFGIEMQRLGTEQKARTDMIRMPLTINSFSFELYFDFVFFFVFFILVFI